MALQHLRSSTADKRPTPAAMSDGQLALNTNLASPGLFFKDSNGDSVKIGPVHVGTTAPNVTPGAGGQAGNSKGEAWLDTTATNPILKVWNGSAFVAVQPVGTGTVVSTTDTGTVTSTMILDGTILNADINASAAIVDTKLATIATAGKVSNSATTATNANTASAIVARDASGNFTAGTITAALTGAASSNVLKAGDTMTGALVVPLASAATPSLTFTGDLNTGIYSPGADQLAVATNGTGRLFITSTGLVGIGTATPSQLLQIEGASNPAALIKNTTSNVQAYFYANSTTGIFGTSTPHPLVFNVENLEKARIDTSGRLGIGTTSPAAKLDVNGDIFASGGDIYIGINRMLSSDFGTRPLIFGLGAVEKARIDSSARLLVGTSSARSNVYYGTTQITPNHQYEFNSNNFNSGISLLNYSGGYPSVISLGYSNSTTQGTNAVVTSGTDLGLINFVGNDGTNFRTGATITGTVDGTPGTGDMPGRLVFSVTADAAASPTERMRITNSGRTVVLGNSNAFDAYSAQGAGTSFELFIGGYSATSTTPGSGTTSFKVFTNGNVQNTNNSYGALSDIKLKENIVDANSQWNDLKALQVRNYNFKEGQTHTQIGLVAQEVELISPGLVSETPDRNADGNDLGTVTKSVNYSVLYMKAVKALQEAMERIEALEADVAQLKGA